MTERKRMTVSYRLLAKPEFGPTLGNTIIVGLDVDDVDQYGQLLYEGLPTRIDEIKNALDHSRTFRGHLFDTRYAATARALRSVMRSPSVSKLLPELLTGAEIFARAVPDSEE